jgi:hypothetical protein
LGVEGDTGGPRGGEPRVPGVRGHAQVHPDRFRNMSTTHEKISLKVNGHWADQARNT